MKSLFQPLCGKQKRRTVTEKHVATLLVATQQNEVDGSVSISRNPIISVLLLLSWWLLASISQRKQDSCWVEAKDKNEKDNLPLCCCRLPAVQQPKNNRTQHLSGCLNSAQQSPPGNKHGEISKNTQHFHGRRRRHTSLPPARVRLCPRSRILAHLSHAGRERRDAARYFVILLH